MMRTKIKRPLVTDMLTVSAAELKRHGKEIFYLAFIHINELHQYLKAIRIFTYSSKRYARIWRTVYNGKSMLFVLYILRGVATSEAKD